MSLRYAWAPGRWQLRPPPLECRAWLDTWATAHLVVVYFSFRACFWGFDLLISCWGFLHRCSFSSCCLCLLAAGPCWPPSVLSSETLENRCDFFPEWSVELTNEPVCAQCFLFRTVTDDRFLNRPRPVSSLRVLADCVIQGIGPFHLS